MRKPTQGSGVSDNAPEYRQVFLIQVHRLLQIGYERLNHAGFADAKEPVISGRIAEQIENFLDEPAMQGWETHYEVFNENPEHHRRRAGNERLKTDIRIKSSRTSPRLRFIFEAKRLQNAGSLRAYFSGEGLGAFLNEDYAKDSLDAGMLGYVQADTPEAWVAKVETQLRNSTRELCVIASRAWQKQSFPKCGDHTYCSSHIRTASGRQIDIYHTFLLFL
jgi:hypothetical protein